MRNAVPTDIRQSGPDQLSIAWAGGGESTYRVRDLRIACPCASCVDENTGIRRLDPARVPADVRPVNIVSIGNYAIKITWTDGHDTGIYSFELLRRLAEAS